MLTQGMRLDGKHNVIIGSEEDVCFGCATKYASENQVSIWDGIKKLRGKNVGQSMKIFPALRDMNGDIVKLCHKCLEEYFEETE